MLAPELLQRIQPFCPEVDPRVIQEFAAQMDEDYFAAFSPSEIAEHVRMSAALDAKQRVHVRIRPRGSERRENDIIIVGFDYLSEFSVFCGLISAFGLNIHSGNIYSFARTAARASSRKIVDVFRVGLASGVAFGERQQQDFASELQALTNLLAAGSADQARERLNRILTERIEQMNEPLSGLMRPVEIEFDNQSSPEWTVMQIRSEDTFAFLYSVSNALALQGIYIHRVQIRSSGSAVEDVFFVADRWGRKVERPADQERLRRAVAMIKQFTAFLPEAPDPAKAMRHFDQLLDKLAEQGFPDHLTSFLAQAQGVSLLANLLGSSDYLWDDLLRIHFADLMPFLERIGTEGFPSASGKDELQRELHAVVQAAPLFERKREELNRFKDDQLFFIDVRHLLDPRAALDEFSEALTNLAEVVIDEAIGIGLGRLGGDAPGSFAVCGLGKFGGREMGYASDLELIFVHEPRDSGANPFFESLARQVVELIEARDKGIFHIDLRLRPYGDAGAWSTPFSEFQRYYDASGRAEAFERQALVKLRWAAGDETLGRRAETHRDRFSYSGEPWDEVNALHLRRRQMRELVKAGQTNVKYSAGGVIDVEYAVQYLQLLHGGRRPELRSPNTLEALKALQRLEIVPEAEYAVLHDGYIFLRRLIDGLRIVRGDASDLVLPATGSEEFKSLARRLGYREQDRRSAALRLAADVDQWMKTVHAAFTERFGEKL